MYDTIKIEFKVKRIRDDDGTVNKEKSEEELKTVCDMVLNTLRSSDRVSTIRVQTDKDTVSYQLLT